MHIKQRPEDFQVEELTDVQPLEAGDFALYRLEKSGWTTPDALQVIRRRWDLQPRRLQCGGLKDRHAHTVQYLTVFRGPRRQLNQQGIHLKYLGQVGEPYASQHIRANRFRLTVRDMTAAEVDTAHAALDEVRTVGVPNYFDDQRFGSVSGDGRFPARHLMLGEHEAGLRLVLTAAYRYDRAAQKREKATLRRCWGDWATCREKLARGQARTLVDYLVDQPTDFAGALQRLKPELRGLLLSAYQSHLWNRMLGYWLVERLPEDQLVAIPLRLGTAPMPTRLTEEQKAELAELRLPLPSARLDLPEDDPRRVVLNQVLSEEGVTLEQFKLHDLKELFFSRGERAGLCLPADLAGAAGADSLHPGRFAFTLRFELPRGSYATLVVKRITRLPEEAE